MKGAGRDRNHIGEASRWRGEVVITVAPRDDGAVGLEGHAVVGTGRDSHDASEAGRHARLATRVRAPGNNRAIRLERQAV